MAHGHAHISAVRDPGGVGLPPGLKIVPAVLLGAGLLLWGASFAFGGGSLRAWQAMLLAYAFFMMLGLGGIVFTAIQYCANARWSIAVRRIAEGMGAFIPVSFVLFAVIVIFGWNDLYDLNSPAREAIGKGGVVIHDHFKALYLSRWGVLIKGVIFYAVWHLLSNRIRKTTFAEEQHRDAGAHQRNIHTSIAFLVVFAYTFSLHVVDMLQALEVKWFSTMFGVYCFAGCFLTAMCVITLIAHAMRTNPVVAESIKTRHMFDLGTWIMAFSCFMCYVMFSQFMLIWYANLPEETFYLVARSENGWGVIFWLLPLLKWIVPFAILMPQGFRANRTVHILVCGLVLLGQWIDLYWMIYPVFFKSPVMPGLAEIGAFLGVLGLFGITLDRVYSSHSVLPMGDAYLKMSVSGSYI